MPSKVLFVDDMALVIRNDLFLRSLAILKKRFEDYGLRMNFKEDGSKSAIMPYIPPRLGPRES